MTMFAAKNNLQLAMALSGPVLKALRKRRSKKYERWAEEGRPKKKSFLKKVVADIAVSYIIGKAVQMAVLGTKMFMKRRKAAKLKAKLAG